MALSLTYDAHLKRSYLVYLWNLNHKQENIPIRCGLGLVVSTNVLFMYSRGQCYAKKIIWYIGLWFCSCELLGGLYHLTCIILILPLRMCECICCPDSCEGGCEIEKNQDFVTWYNLEWNENLAHSPETVQKV